MGVGKKLFDDFWVVINYAMLIYPLYIGDDHIP